VLVAVDEASDRVLGCVTYVPGPGTPLSELAGPDEAEFRMLGVAPDAQGRGVGEALVRACIARARAEGRVRLVLSTTDPMEAAQRLYARLGFRRAPSRDWEPVPGVRLIVYVLEL
jgi:ribosomal protein S18 acetylase RimI-like enzyme